MCHKVNLSIQSIIFRVQQGCAFQYPHSSSKVLFHLPGELGLSGSRWSSCFVKKICLLTGRFCPLVMISVSFSSARLLLFYSHGNCVSICFTDRSVHNVFWDVLMQKPGVLMLLQWCIYHGDHGNVVKSLVLLRHRMPHRVITILTGSGHLVLSPV